MSGDNKVAAAVTETTEPKVYSIAPLGQSGGEISKVPINIVNASAPMRKSSIEILDPSTIYPEYVRSIKEKECWLLFQKMVKKGIAVSYETILRGILTPSEVLILLNQFIYKAIFQVLLFSIYLLGSCSRKEAEGNYRTTS